MPTRRTPLQHGRGGGLGVTPAALAAFIAACELSPDDEGYKAAKERLNDLLGRRAPWLTDVLTVNADQPPPEWLHRTHIADWEKATAIRKALEEAADELAHRDVRCRE